MNLDEIQLEVIAHLGQYDARGAIAEMERIIAWLTNESFEGGLGRGLLDAIDEFEETSFIEDDRALIDWCRDWVAIERHQLRSQIPGIQDDAIMESEA